MGSTGTQDDSRGTVNFFSQLAKAADTEAQQRPAMRVRRRKGRMSRPSSTGNSRALAEELADVLQQQLDATLAAHDAARAADDSAINAARSVAAEPKATPPADSPASQPTPACEAAQAVATQPAPADRPAQAAPASTCTDPLAARYDVRNISSTELSMLGTELYQAGRITREIYAMLSFQPETHACYDEVGAQGTARPDPARKRDALAEWKSILKQQQEFGYSSYFLIQSREVIDLLSRLDRHRRGIK